MLPVVKFVAEVMLMVTLAVGGTKYKPAGITLPVVVAVIVANVKYAPGVFAVAFARIILLSANAICHYSLQ